MTIDLESKLPKTRKDFATETEWLEYKEAIASSIFAKFAEIADICRGNNLTVVRKDGKA